MRPKLTLIAVLAGAAMTAQADVYRFVDAQGRVQYSDRWVPGSTLIKTSHPRASAEAAAAHRAAEQSKLNASNERIAAQQSQQAAAQAMRQDLAAARSEQCKQAKEFYEKTIQARRLYRVGKDGEREYLSDEQADEQRLQARLEMQNACGAAPK